MELPPESLFKHLAEAHNLFLNRIALDKIKDVVLREALSDGTLEIYNSYHRLRIAMPESLSKKYIKTLKPN